MFLDSALAPTPTPAPAVWRAVAIPLPPLPDVGDAALVTPEEAEDQPPAQLFGHFAEGTPVELLPPQAAPQVFLTPPRNADYLRLIVVKDSNYVGEPHQIQIVVE
ncbi:MAG TPA: hypothetical protein PK829_08495 [Promineifilum sp.]|nr:hypothetical protein [Promineifilum sp.]